MIMTGKNRFSKLFSEMTILSKVEGMRVPPVTVVRSRDRASNDRLSVCTYPAAIENAGAPVVVLATALRLSGPRNEFSFTVMSRQSALANTPAAKSSSSICKGGN